MNRFRLWAPLNTRRCTTVSYTRHRGHTMEFYSLTQAKWVGSIFLFYFIISSPVSINTFRWCVNPVTAVGDWLFACHSQYFMSHILVFYMHLYKLWKLSKNNPKQPCYVYNAFCNIKLKNKEFIPLKWKDFERYQQNIFIRKKRAEHDNSNAYFLKTIQYVWLWLGYHFKAYFLLFPLITKSQFVTHFAGSGHI